MIRIYDSGHRGECRSEMAEQMDCISWLQYNHPDRWPLIFHVPGEIKASPQYMQRRKKEGVKPGIPDIIDMGGAMCGLFELKRADKTKTKLSANQKNILQAAAEVGHFSAVCYGFTGFKLAYDEFIAISRQSYGQAE